jgi:hypothetical protein
MMMTTIAYACNSYEDEFGALEVQDRILFKSRLPLITRSVVSIAKHVHSSEFLSLNANP